MEKNADLYNLTQATQGMVWRAAFGQYQSNLSEEEKANQQPTPSLFQIRGGYAESPGWMMVQAAEFEPEPLSVERFRRRAVYSSPSLSLAMLELLASEKWLDRKGDDYHLTDEGRKIIARLLERRVKPFAGFEPLPVADLERFVDLCRRVIEASSRAPEPPGTWCLDHSRNRAPKGEIPLLANYIQFGSDFNAFRDDVHMAAYGQYNVAGHVWEGFMYLVDEKAKNADDLYQHLAYRGFYTEDWQAALDDLCNRGWITAKDNVYSVTDTGQAVRHDVEQKTDEYFYAPWEVLAEEEYEELTSLMQKLHDMCEGLVNA